MLNIALMYVSFKYKSEKVLYYRFERSEKYRDKHEANYLIITTSSLVYVSVNDVIA